MPIASIPTTQKAILDAVIARLQGQIAAFNSTTLFLAASADEAMQQAKRQQAWGCVIPMAGTFDDSEFTGGGQFAVVEKTGVTVILFSRHKLDQAGESTYWMADGTNGILELKRLVLKALTKWVPTSGSDRLVISAIQPIHSDPPQRNNGDKVGDLALTFATDFEWDLTT